MGKRGSELCKLILKGLEKDKYPNLKRLSDSPVTFQICFPRKTTKLDPAYEQFLKDWRALKRKPYKYSMAKQAVETALKKSDFFKKIARTDNGWIIYQILDDDEILRKKKSKATTVKLEYHNPLSVESSGYGSGGDTGNSSTSDEEMVEVKDEIAPVPEEQFLIVQNAEDPYQSYADYYLLDDVNSLVEPDLPCVNPNEILIDQRNDIWQHFKEMYKEEVDEEEDISDVNVNDQCTDSLNPYYLQDAFADMNLESCEGDSVDMEELMKLDLQNFEEVIKEDKKPKMIEYRLKKVENTAVGEIWIFSPNEFEDVKGFNEETNLKDGSRIAADDKQMEKISAAVRSPLNIGCINGEIHLCLKH